MTSSPDSSPSPIAIALGQVNPQTTISLSSGVGGNGSSGGGSGGGGGSNNSSGAGTGGSNSTSTAIQNQLSESKLWMSANSTTASPHSLSPKAFSFDSGTNPTSTADSGNPADTLRLVFTVISYLHHPTRQFRRSHCPHEVCTIGLGLHLIVVFLYSLYFFFFRSSTIISNSVPPPLFPLSCLAHGNSKKPFRTPRHSICNHCLSILFPLQKNPHLHPHQSERKKKSKL